MDRFIVSYTKLASFEKKGLKSNMDRFIAKLRSVYGERFAFKIQYG